MAPDEIKRLTALEGQWLTRQHKRIQRSSSLRGKTDVYNAWREIFQQYAALAAQDVEALKRAIYLCWTQQSQDPFLSGVDGLDQAATGEVLASANRLAKTEELDDELRWMLSYYYFVEPSYLDRFQDLDHLKRVSRHDPLAYRQECLKGSFDNRGHMGRYWKAKQAILHLWP